MSPVVILRLRNMTALDATGLRAMQDFADAIHASGRVLVLCGAPPRPARLMARAEFHRHVGAESILPNVGGRAHPGRRTPKGDCLTSKTASSLL
jgi:sulfate permease, SulP family